MKYLYKGMGMPGWGDVSGSVLLVWHERVSVYCFIDFLFRLLSSALTLRGNALQLTEVAGTGCIVRAMTDRRVV